MNRDIKEKAEELFKKYPALFENIKWLEELKESGDIAINTERQITEFYILVQSLNQQEQKSVSDEEIKEEAEKYLKNKLVNECNHISFNEWSTNGYRKSYKSSELMTLFVQSLEQTAIISKNHAELEQIKEICTTIFDDGFMCSSCDGKCKHPVTVEWIEEQFNKDTVREEVFEELCLECYNEGGTHGVSGYKKCSKGCEIPKEN